MTTEETNIIGARIYAQAINGTPVNTKGVPRTLANLLVAQARHETGNFSSNAFLLHNNAFGYAYVPGARYQSGSGLIADNNQPVANYRSVEDSTNEIVDWIYRRLKEGKFPPLDTITTAKQYTQLLKDNRYFEDNLSTYYNAVQRFFLDNPVTTTAVKGVLFVAVIFVIVYLLFKYKKI